MDSTNTDCKSEATWLVCNIITVGKEQSALKLFNNNVILVQNLFKNLDTKNENLLINIIESLFILLQTDFIK